MFVIKTMGRASLIQDGILHFSWRTRQSMGTSKGEMGWDVVLGIGPCVHAYLGNE